MYRLIFLCIFFSTIGEANLLTNGDFEQELTVGWSQSTSYGSIERFNHYDPDADYEASVYLGGSQYDSNYVRLYQKVDIASPDLVLSLRARMYCSGTSGYWAVAGIMVSYLDCLNNELGCSIICTWVNECPWSDDSTTHVIQVVHNEWASYILHLNGELANLPGIDPDSVQSIEVSLLCLTGEQRC